CLRRTRRTQTDVRCADPRGRTLAWLAHDRIRTPPTNRDPQRAQSRSRRANRADRKSKCHRIPNSFIQHESDLTTLVSLDAQGPNVKRLDFIPFYSLRRGGAGPRIGHEAELPAARSLYRTTYLQRCRDQIVGKWLWTVARGSGAAPASQQMLGNFRLHHRVSCASLTHVGPTQLSMVRRKSNADDSDTEAAL